MNRSRLPTRHEVEELTAFLPKLYAQGFIPIEQWGGGEQEVGSIQLRYPFYDAVVTAFFSAASAECWTANQPTRAHKHRPPI